MKPKISDIFPQMQSYLHYDDEKMILKYITKLEEELAQVKVESENHNKSFLNMFEQNEEKSKIILDLQNDVDSWKRIYEKEVHSSTTEYIATRKEIQALKAMIVEARPWVKWAINNHTGTMEFAKDWLTKTEKVKVAND